MSLTVGTDTYATLEEATTYIGKHYPSAAAKRVAWEALDEADQEIYMRLATEKIDRCQFQGIKAQTSQALEFPRFFYQDALPIVYEPEDLSTETSTVPEDVKAAEVEEALELVSPGEDTDEKNLRTGAVKSYRIGNLSEDYGSSAAKSTAAYKLNSSRAVELLEKYINGSYRIV
jgi:hypothetical protein